MASLARYEHNCISFSFVKYYLTLYRSLNESIVHAGRQLHRLHRHSLLHPSHDRRWAICDAVQQLRFRILSRRQPDSMARGGAQRFHVRIQCVDLFRRGGRCLKLGCRSHRPLFGCVASLFARLLRVCLAMEAHANLDRDGIPLRSFWANDASDLLLGDNSVSALYERPYALWAKSIRLNGMPVLRYGNYSHHWRSNPLLQCSGRTLGCGSCRLSTGLHLAPILHCSRCRFADACWRLLWTYSFSTPAYEEYSCSWRVWMDLCRLLGCDGLVWLQHQIRRAHVC